MYRLVGTVAIAMFISACGTTALQDAVSSTAATAATTTAVATTAPADTSVPSTTAPDTTSSTSTTTAAVVDDPAWIDSLAAGVCFDDVFDNDGGFDFSVPAAVVDCNSPHDNEIVSAVELTDGEFGGLDAVSDEAGELCTTELEDFLSPAMTESDLLAAWLVFPDATDWANGERTALCVVYGSEPLVGSAASGSLRAPGEILVVVSEIDSVTDVWLVDTDTGSLDRNLSDDDLLAQKSPASIRSDLTTVAYAAGADDTDRDIFFADIAGGVVPVIEGVPSAGSPRFSPDGNSLAFIAAPDGEFDIFIVDVDGGEPLQLTNNPDRDTSPNWSPDGTQLAFRGRSDGNSDVYIIGADGSGLTRLTDDAGFDGDPSWSPDGSQILFTSDRAGNFDIWTMAPDGTGQVQLTDHPADDEYPAWSSDGSLIAFHSSRHGGITVWLMRADGSEQSNLTWFGPTGYPAFAPAG